MKTSDQPKIFILLPLSLVWIKRIRRQWKFKISLYNSSDGNPCRQSITFSIKHQWRSSSAKTANVGSFRKKAPPQISDWIPYVDPTRGAVNLGGGMGAGWVDWNCMALVATGFFCCVDKLGRPVVKMPWAYLFSKNK